MAADTMTMAAHSPWTSPTLDDVLIRPSPPRPFEVASSPTREPLVPCDICGRKFNQANLERHKTICERLAQKPKREAFQAIAQRLAHVAQEDAIKPLIRENIHKPSAGYEDEATPAKAAAVKKRRPLVRAERTETAGVTEIPRGHSKCQYCERTFRDETYTRHVNFCKDQYEVKLRKQTTGQENLQSVLLMRRVKYRPPLPRSLRKAVSAFSHQKMTPTPSKVASSQSATEPPKAAPKPKSFVTHAVSALKSRPGVGDEKKGLGKSGLVNFGCGETLLMRTGSLRLKGYKKDKPEVNRGLVNTGEQNWGVAVSRREEGDGNDGTSPMDGKMEAVVRSMASLRTSDWQTLPATAVQAASQKSETVATGQERPYPFNVASAQKERMMQLHRSNSVKAKSASVGAVNVDWDSFLRPAHALRTTNSNAKPDTLRFFQWDGDRLRAPRDQTLTKLPQDVAENFRKMTSASLEGRLPPLSPSPVLDKRNNAMYKLPVSHEESVEEAYLTSDSTSPVSPVDSMKSSALGSLASVKSSAGIGSLSSFSSGIPPTASPLITSKLPSLPHFCHNCGKRFPLADAAFCCHCGMRRLVSLAD